MLFEFILWFSLHALSEASHFERHFSNQWEAIKAATRSTRSCFVFLLSFWKTSEPRDAEWHNLGKMIPLRHCYRASLSDNTLLFKQLAINYALLGGTI